MIWNAHSVELRAHLFHKAHSWYASETVVLKYHHSTNTVLFCNCLQKVCKCLQDHLWINSDSCVSQSTLTHVLNLGKNTASCFNLRPQQVYICTAVHYTLLDKHTQMFLHYLWDKVVQQSIWTLTTQKCLKAIRTTFRSNYHLQSKTAGGFLFTNFTRLQHFLINCVLVDRWSHLSFFSNTGVLENHI